MKTKLLSTFLLVSAFAFAQADLDINNIKARLNPAGDLFWDFSNPKFEAPQNSGVHSIFSGNLWIGGIDGSGQLRVAAQTYRQNGTDYWPGPMDTIIVECPVAVTTSPQWNRVWKINKTTIDSFIQGLFQTIPQSIAQWPGNGDPQYNQQNTLAPFFDMNGDGLYAPSAGDYPIIRGDQAVYFIYNDHEQGSQHTETGGLPLGLEIHGMAYAFKCTGDSALANTVFIHYRIINRSSFMHNNCYIGAWTDMDLGFYADDLIGSFVDRDAYYTYNGDAMDGSGGPGSYGNRLGAQACVFLQGPLANSNDGIDNDKDCMLDEVDEHWMMSKFLYYNNDTTVIGNPDADTAYYNYISGFWKDNTPMTYGGNGHNTGTPCSYMFPGTSDQQWGWGLGGSCNPPSPVPSTPWDDVNSPADRRGVGSTGPITMQPGGVYTLDLAFVFGRDYTASGVQQSINVMTTRIDSIRSYFAANSTPCGGNFNTGLNETQNSVQSISVYPNPAKHELFISCNGISNNAVIEIYDVNGKKMLEAEDLKLEGMKIDLSAFADGLYILRIADGEKSVVKKFVKE